MANDEMLKHFNMMKKCKKTDDKITGLYAMMCLFCAGVTLFTLLLGVNDGGFLAFLDGVIAKLAILAFGYYACYSHLTKFIFFSMTISCATIWITPVNILITLVVITLSVLTSMNNKTYHYLEQQFGFPYFSERFEEQNIDTRQRGIKDEYQQNLERYQKTASDEMSDIDMNYRPENIGKNIYDNSGKMDDI